MDQTTIAGLIALALGALWKAFPWLKQFLPKSASSVSEAPADGPMTRLEALRYAELVLQYLEQHNYDEGQEALRQVVEVLFTTPKE